MLLRWLLYVGAWGLELYIPEGGGVNHAAAGCSAVGGCCWWLLLALFGWGSAFLGVNVGVLFGFSCFLVWLGLRVI